MFFLVLKHVSDTNYFAEESVIPPQEIQDSKMGNFGVATDVVGIENGVEKPSANLTEEISS